MRSGLLTAGILLIPALAMAQSVDEIVARHIAARGGIDKLTAIQTLKITRTVATGIGNNVRVIMYKKRPNLYRAEQGPTTPGAPMTPRGVNADDAWDTAPGGKITLRAEAAEAEARDLEGDFDGLLVNWKEKGHAVTFEGRASMPDGEALKLRVRTKSGAERIIYLDATTYLDRRHTGVLTLPNGRRDVVTDFSNWQDVNGVKFPFDINEDRTGGNAPEQSLVIYTEKIEANVPMDETLFATPKGTGPPGR
ncbi:MAG TPA: hypothetical protein VFZ73_05755 [Gemmatimonadaceae bacterium]